MEQNIATDTEQSKRMIACGVDPISADMFWRLPITLVGKRKKEIYLLIKDDSELWETDTPSWSLSRLLLLLPSQIFIENRKQFTMRLIPVLNGKAWICEYDGHDTCLYQSNGKTAIEAVVRMIETLSFHKHKLNDIKE